MLDKFLLNVVNTGDRRAVNKDISPKATLTNFTILPTTNPQKLVVIFPYWSSSANANMSKLSRKLQNTETSVLLPELHENYMQADIDFVLKAYDYLSRQIARQIGDLFSGSGIKLVHLIGFSMGNVLLCNTVRHLSEIPSLAITQILGASEIAGPLWEGSRTSHLREAFIDQGISLAQLKKAWQSIDPINIELPSNIKKCELVTSKHDSVIPTEYQEKYLSHLQANQENFRYKRLSTNHVLSIARYLYLHHF